jgi:diguanylate cyclase (GGDEF)-like protein
LQATIRAICQTEGWEAGRYFRADEQAGLLRFVTAWNTPDAALAPFIAGSARLTFTRGEGIAGRVWVSGEPIWIPEVSADSRVVNVTLSSETRIRSLFVFPVTAEGRTIGVLATFSRLARAPDERLMQAVHVLGSQLGQFLQRMDAEERLALHARRQERIARFGQYAIGETDLDRLYAEALQAVTGDGFADAASVVEVAGGSLVVRAAKGQGADPMRGFAEPLAQDSLWPEMLAANAPRVAGREYLQSFSARPEWRSFTRSMASAVHVPLHAESLHGMLVAYSEREHAFDNDDARAVEAIANILSTALRRRAAEERLAVLAQFDPLTGLPNRALFRDRLEQALAQAVRNRWQVGLLFIDLDRFKWVNDSLGHATGDELLNAVGKRLHACLRAGDTVARLGGDEFAVVLPDLDSPEAAGVVAEKMLEALKAPFAIAEQEMFAGASIGITVFPPDAADAEAMLRNADAAMYRAKEAGRGRYEFFTPAMNTEALRKLALEKDLRQALARSEFELHYQPKAEVESGRITGVEALLRWRRADGALVSPAEFIPVLEDTGLIAEVGDWVIGEACRQHDAWRRAGLDGMCVAVNVSARQFQGGRLLDSVRRALAQNECPAQCLELELTESLVMHDVDVTIETLQALREMGVRIAVDDFGTGYSSLAYLKKLPIDVVKIDRSFVKGVNDDANDAAIASAIIAMARSLGYRVVAEGVETPLQRQVLEALGCHEMQGWLLGRPMPAAEAARWLAGRAA